MKGYLSSGLSGLGGIATIMTVGPLSGCDSYLDETRQPQGNMAPSGPVAGDPAAAVGTRMSPHKREFSTVASDSPATAQFTRMLSRSTPRR